MDAGRAVVAVVTVDHLVGHGDVAGGAHLAVGPAFHAVLVHREVAGRLAAIGFSQEGPLEKRADFLDGAVLLKLVLACGEVGLNPGDRFLRVLLVLVLNLQV